MDGWGGWDGKIKWRGGRNYKMDTTEKRFESDIEAALLSSSGGYTKGTNTYDSELACTSTP